MADKKERRLFVLSEYEEEEQYLRDMARRGISSGKGYTSRSLPFQKSRTSGYGLSVGFSRLRKKYDAEKVK